MELAETDRYLQQSYFIYRERNRASWTWIHLLESVMYWMLRRIILLLGSMKSNNVPKNITDNLKLCTDEEIRLVEAMTQYLVEQHKK